MFQSIHFSAIQNVHYEEKSFLHGIVIRFGSYHYGVRRIQRHRNRHSILRACQRIFNQQIFKAS